MSLDKTVESLVPDWPALPPALRAEVAVNCARFVRAQLALAPLHIRVGVALLLTAYGLYVLLSAGPFASSRARAAALTRFSHLPLPLVAGLERLLRAATLLAFFDQPAVLNVLGEETPQARQRDFRNLRNQMPESAV